MDEAVATFSCVLMIVCLFRSTTENRKIERQDICSNLVSYLLHKTYRIKLCTIRRTVAPGLRLAVIVPVQSGVVLR